MTSDRLVAVVNDLGVECFGADWFDFRDRAEKWATAHPRVAREFVHYVRLLMEDWDHE
jgi:hypothetical protein